MRGFSLSEVLVSLFLSSLLLSVLMGEYVTVVAQYRALTRHITQELNETFATRWIRFRLKRAGFTPCKPLSQLKRLDNEAAIQPITITQGSILQLNSMSEASQRVIEAIASDNLTVQHSLILNPKKSVLLANCHEAEKATLLDMKKSGGVVHLLFEKPLHIHMDEPLYVGSLIEESFSVKRLLSGQLGLLYQRGGHADELWPDIDAWSIQQVNPRVISMRIHPHQGRDVEIVTRVGL
jgi:hypothetical protein